MTNNSTPASQCQDLKLAIEQANQQFFERMGGESSFQSAQEHHQRFLRRLAEVFTPPMTAKDESDQV